ncbi:hypothetical protein SNE40_003335 [Patella caerulea]|uniref:SCP domain-containing protein n=1 Tax=Patella caerulea TaxID=87958 RepID=A0AAN8KB05_PATCE
MTSVYSILGIYYFLLISQGQAAVSSDPSEDDVNQYVLSRNKRSTSNYDLVSSHSVCQDKSDEATETGVSEADKTLIVNLHNLYRSNANPPASNMLKMRWNDEIALIAQKWAEHCDMTHDGNKERSVPARYSVGQNLAMGASGFQHAVDLWQSENSTFVYNGSNALLEVGHYTQINWADTNLVGCGYAKCGTRNYHVCNYATAGNVAGKLGTPYISGTPCSACPGRCVDNKLCDCDVTCWHGATLDRTTCTCTCLNDMYLAPACKLDCEKSDPSSGGFSCSGSFGQQTACPNYPTYCPHKCDYCPVADYRNVEKGFISCLGGGGDILTVHYTTLLLLLGAIFLTVLN